MTSRVVDSERIIRLRGQVLELVYLNHREQRPHMDGGLIWGVLNKLQASVSRNESVTVLQDLEDRGYLKCVQTRDEWTGRVSVSRIEITAKGRDLVEETASDPAVRILR